MRRPRCFSSIGLFKVSYVNEASGVASHDFVLLGAVPPETVDTDFSKSFQHVAVEGSLQVITASGISIHSAVYCTLHSAERTHRQTDHSVAKTAVGICGLSDAA